MFSGEAEAHEAPVVTSVSDDGPVIQVYAADCAPAHFPRDPSPGKAYQVPSLAQIENCVPAARAAVCRAELECEQAHLRFQQDSVAQVAMRLGLRAPRPKPPMFLVWLDRGQELSPDAGTATIF